MHQEVFKRRLDAYTNAADVHLSIEKKKSKPWAAFAAASGAALVATQATEAAIIPIPSTPISFSATSTFIGNGYLNVDGIGGADLGFFLNAYGLNTFGVQRLNAFFSGGAFVATANVNGASIINLSSGFSIGPTLATGSFANAGSIGFYGQNLGFGPDPGQFVPGNTGLAGFSFAGVSGTQFGWIRLRIDHVGNTTTLNILEGAYEDTGAPIQAGAIIPEPSSLALGSLGLLALGAAGIRERRKRLKAAQAQDATA